MVLVVEEWVLVPDAVEAPPEGVMVWTPPPTVETMVRPTLLVLVMTSPFVREDEEVSVVEGDSPAEIGVDVVELESEPAATAPLDEALADAAAGVLEPSPAGVVLVSEVVVGVLEDVSPP